MSDAPAVRDDDTPAVDSVPGTLLPDRDETNRIWALAHQLQHTEFVPQPMQGRPEKILAAIIAGREMGVPAMRSLQHINIIEGQAQPSAELHLAQALKAGHHLEVVETSRERCTVEVHRRDWPPDKPARTLTWELDDAVQAGLVQLKDGKPHARSAKGQALPWEKYPRAMLRARAITEACRTWLPDAIEGADLLPPAEPPGPAPVVTVEATDGAAHTVDATTGEIIDGPADDEPAQGSPAGDSGGEDFRGDVTSDRVEELISELQAAGDRGLDADTWRDNANRSANGRHAVIRTLESRLARLQRGATVGADAAAAEQEQLGGTS